MNNIRKKDSPTAQKPTLLRHEESRDGLWAAIALAIFLHLLLFWATPTGMFEPDTAQLIPQSLEVVLEPLPETPEMEESYVRATPDVPEAIPEDTLNISDRDQRAAQEETVPPDPENTPYVEGDMEESNRLVQGNPFMEPTPPAPPVSSPSSGSSPMVRQEAAPKERPAQVNPDYAEDEPLEDEGVASIPDPDTALEEPEELAELLKPVDQTSSYDGAGEAAVTTPEQQVGEESPQPRPRQRVERDTSYGPIKDNRQGAIQIGRLAFDAQYSEFGEYWRRVAEIIESHWRNLVYNTKSIPFGGYRVVVTFAITRKGEVVDVAIRESDAGRLAETISKDAIMGKSPFFEWTPEMIVKMGDQAECSIHFFY
jgi:hypothetical protein